MTTLSSRPLMGVLGSGCWAAKQPNRLARPWCSRRVCTSGGGSLWQRPLCLQLRCMKATNLVPAAADGEEREVVAGGCLEHGRVATNLVVHVGWRCQRHRGVSPSHQPYPLSLSPLYTRTRARAQARAMARAMARETFLCFNSIRSPAWTSGPPPLASTCNQPAGGGG